MKLPAHRPRIRCGQFWKKRDIGLIVQLTGRNSKGYYSYRKISSTGHTKGHSVSERDLHLFWEPMFKF